MKKLFYGLGAIAAVTAPIVAVVSCGSKDGDSINGDVHLGNYITFSIKDNVWTSKFAKDPNTIDKSEYTPGDEEKLYMTLFKFMNANKGNNVTINEGDKYNFVLKDRQTSTFMVPNNGFEDPEKMMEYFKTHFNECHIDT